MRLIDAHDLMERLYDANPKGRVELAELIETEPTVDAVEVVRCKDCKWWDKTEDSPFGYCMAMKHGYNSANWEIGIYRKYKGDFYCADGERKEDEVEEDE